MRLKGGDPFVFWRGGEEAEALAQSEGTLMVLMGVAVIIDVDRIMGLA